MPNDNPLIAKAKKTLEEAKRLERQGMSLKLPSVFWQRVLDKPEAYDKFLKTTDFKLMG